MGTGPEFFQTGMGKVFFEATMPNLARAMQAIAEHLIKGDVMRAEEAERLAENEFWDKAFLAGLSYYGNLEPPEQVGRAHQTAELALKKWKERAAKLKAIPA